MSAPLASIRVLVVDGFKPWRKSLRSMLKKHAKLRVVGDVADGVEAVQKASKLKPDLILLGIELPNLNGIEVAKRIRPTVPDAKMVFLTIESEADMVQAALNSGGQGYVLKTDAGSELLPAIDAVLQGKQYVSSGCRTQTNRSLVLVN